MGIYLMKKCDEVRVYYFDGVSDGMDREICMAKLLDKTIIRSYYD